LEECTDSAGLSTFGFSDDSQQLVGLIITQRGVTLEVLKQRSVKVAFGIPVVDYPIGISRFAPVLN